MGVTFKVGISFILLAFFILFLLSKVSNFTYSAEKIQRICYQEKEKDRYSCIKEKLIEVTLSKEGPLKALKIVKELDQKDNFVHQYCHSFIHEIGEAAYKKYNNIKVALKYGDATCFSGYYHGIFLAAFPNLKDDQLNREIPFICDTFPSSTDRFMRYQCLHGVGHGLTVLYQYDVFKALDKCELFKDEWDQVSCSSGVFMENAFPRHLEENFNPPHRKKDNPIYPCNKVPEKYWPMCYSMTSAIVLEFGGSIKEAFEVCQNLKNKNARFYCYGGVGRAITGFTNYNVDDSLNLCLSGPKEAILPCIIDLALGFTTNYASTSYGALICHKAPQEVKQECFRQLGMQIPSLHGYDRKSWVNLCRSIAGEFASFCIEGLRLVIP